MSGPSCGRVWIQLIIVHDDKVKLMNYYVLSSTYLTLLRRYLSINILTALGPISEKFERPDPTEYRKLNPTAVYRCLLRYCLPTPSA